MSILNDKLIKQTEINQRINIQRIERYTLFLSSEGLMYGCRLLSSSCFLPFTGENRSGDDDGVGLGGGFVEDYGGFASNGD